MPAPLIAMAARLLGPMLGRAGASAAASGAGRAAGSAAASGGGGGMMGQLGQFMGGNGGKIAKHAGNMLFSGGQVQGKQAAFSDAFADVADPAQTAARGLSRLKDAASEGVLGFLKMPGILSDVNKQLLDMQRPLASFSAQMSIAFAQLDRNRTMRQMQMAQQTGGTTSSLASSQNRLETALQPFQVAITNATNRIYTVLTNIAATAVELLDPVVKIWNFLWGDEQKKIENPPVAQFLADVAAGRLQGRVHPDAERR